MTFPCRRWVTLLGALVLTLTACGTRIPHAEVVRDAGAGNGTASAGAADGAGEAAAASASGAADLGTASGSSSSGAATAGATGSAAANGTAAGATGGAAKTSGTSGSSSGSASPAAAGAPSAAQAPGGGPASGPPIALGNVGTYSGVVGSSLSGGQPMVKVWAAWVNQHGGINGHPVTIITADDGGDPSKARALTQQMVEQDHVIAFVGDMIPVTAASVGDYLDQKKVPALGGDLSAPDWNEHPMLFPQGTGALALYDESVHLDAKFIDKAGGNKWGAMYCAEDSACSLSYQHANAEAPKVGLNPVYGEQVSLTQPSYTAQCLNAKSKGVNILVVTLDANSINRVGRDCSAQGFHPLYASGSVIVTSDLAKDPNLDGLTSIEPTFGWTFSGSPAAQEYQAAIKAISPNLAMSSATSANWVAGKMLQAALAKVSPTAPVTSADVLDGLYQMHDETLGGLAPALNFVRDKPAPLARCYFGVQVTGGSWTALNNGQQYC